MSPEPPQWCVFFFFLNWGWTKLSSRINGGKKNKYVPVCNPLQLNVKRWNAIFQPATLRWRERGKAASALTDPNRTFPIKTECISFAWRARRAEEGLDENQARNISDSCECFPCLMPQQKPRVWQIWQANLLVNDNKSSQDSCPGWKSYTSSFSEEEKKKNSPPRPSAAAQRMAGGFAAWKAGEERGGALWQALCERDGSRINCSGGRLPIAVSELSSSVPGERPGLNRTTKCLPRPLFSAKWALSLEWQD